MPCVTRNRQVAVEYLHLAATIDDRGCRESLRRRAAELILPRAVDLEMVRPSS